MRGSWQRGRHAGIDRVAFQFCQRVIADSMLHYFKPNLVIRLRKLVAHLHHRRDVIGIVVRPRIAVMQLMISSKTVDGNEKRKCRKDVA